MLRQYVPTSVMTGIQPSRQWLGFLLCPSLCSLLILGSQLLSAAEKPVFDPQRVAFASDSFQIFTAGHSEQSRLEGHPVCSYEGIQWQADRVQFHLFPQPDLGRNLLDSATFFASATQPVLFDSRAVTIPDFNMRCLIQATQMDVRLEVNEKTFTYVCRMTELQQATGTMRADVDADSWFDFHVEAESMAVTLRMQRAEKVMTAPIIRRCALTQVSHLCLFNEATGQRIEATGLNVVCLFDAQGMLQSLSLTGDTDAPDRRVLLQTTQDGIQRQYQAHSIRVELRAGVVQSMYTSTDSVLRERRVAQKIAPCHSAVVE